MFNDTSAHKSLPKVLTLILIFLAPPIFETNKCDVKITKSSEFIDFKRNPGIAIV